MIGMKIVDSLSSEEVGAREISREL